MVKMYENIVCRFQVFVRQGSHESVKTEIFETGFNRWTSVFHYDSFSALREWVGEESVTGGRW